MEYASKDIRNILVAGHAGCGKNDFDRIPAVFKRCN